MESRGDSHQNTNRKRLIPSEPRLPENCKHICTDSSWSLNGDTLNMSGKIEFVLPQETSHADAGIQKTFDDQLHFSNSSVEMGKMVYNGDSFDVIALGHEDYPCQSHYLKADCQNLSQSGFKKAGPQIHTPNFEMNINSEMILHSNEASMFYDATHHIHAIGSDQVLMQEIDPRYSCESRDYSFLNHYNQLISPYHRMESKGPQEGVPDMQYYSNTSSASFDEAHMQTFFPNLETVGNHNNSRRHGLKQNTPQSRKQEAKRDKWVQKLFRGRKLDFKNQCLVPHMCNFCKINDHDYCNKNDGSEAKPLVKPCIHVVRCDHFPIEKQLTAEVITAKKSVIGLSRMNQCKSKPELLKQSTSDVKIQVSSSELEVTYPDLEIQCNDQYGVVNTDHITLNNYEKILVESNTVYTEDFTNLESVPNTLSGSAALRLPANIDNMRNKCPIIEQIINNEFIRDPDKKCCYFQPKHYTKENLHREKKTAGGETMLRINDQRMISLENNLSRVFPNTDDDSDTSDKPIFWTSHACEIVVPQEDLWYFPSKKLTEFNNNLEFEPFCNEEGPYQLEDSIKMSRNRYQQIFSKVPDGYRKTIVKVVIKWLDCCRLSIQRIIEDPVQKTQKFQKQNIHYVIGSMNSNTIYQVTRQALYSHEPNSLLVDFFAKHTANYMKKMQWSANTFEIVLIFPYLGSGQNATGGIAQKVTKRPPIMKKDSFAFQSWPYYESFDANGKQPKPNHFDVQVENNVKVKSGTDELMSPRSSAEKKRPILVSLLKNSKTNL